jgi:predicted transcriptional regulator of viral defense system
MELKMKTRIIRDRIAAKGAGWIFSAMDFADLIDRNSIDQMLFRLYKTGLIRKLATGLYDIPVVNKQFGPIPPDPDKVAHVLAKKFDAHLQVNPAQAAHYLGLTQQVPTQAVYLTDGLSKVVKVGNQTLKFVHVSPKKMLGAGTKSGIVIQALYYFGKDNLDSHFLISRIRSQLNDTDKTDLLSLAPRSPLWMQPIIRNILHDA